MENRPDNILIGLQTLTALTGGGGESRINTGEQIDPITRVKLPLMHAGLIILGFCGGFLGIFMLTWGLDWLFRLDWDPPSYIIAWSLLFIVGYLAQWWVRTKLSLKSHGIQLFASTLAIITLGLVIGSFLVTTRERFGWQMIAIVLGGGIILGSLMLLYNQGLYIVRPYWPRSPYEEDVSRLILPAIQAVLNAQANEREPQYSAPQLFPVWQNGKVAAIRADNVNMMVELDDGLENQPILLHPDDANFIEFIEEARERGLNRQSWLGKGTKEVILPTTGLIVKRKAYDQQIDRLEQWGFIRRGGDGIGTEWRVPPDEALEILRQEIYAQRMDDST